MTPTIETITDIRPSDKHIRHLYPRIQKGLQIDFVPNFFRYQASTPAIAEACWEAVEHILIDGVIPRTIKEMIFVAVSRANQCKYCETAHLAFCKNLGVDLALRDALLSNLSALKPDRTRFIIALAVRLSQRPNTITLTDRTELARHGIPEQELLEVISIAAFANYANVIAESLAIPIDHGFLEILNQDHAFKSPPPMIIRH